MTDETQDAKGDIMCDLDHSQCGVDIEKMSKATDRFRNSLKTVPTERLRSLEFALESLAQMPHHLVVVRNRVQWGLKALDASLIRWAIERELDKRKGDPLEYSWDGMQSAMGLLTKTFQELEL